MFFGDIWKLGQNRIVPKRPKQQPTHPGSQAPITPRLLFQPEGLNKPTADLLRTKMEGGMADCWIQSSRDCGGKKKKIRFFKKVWNKTAWCLMDVMS